MFRRLFIWMMLFLLPLQSFAAANILPHCAPSTHEQTPVAFEHRHTETDTTPIKDTGHAHASSVATTTSVDSHDHSGESDVSHHKTACCASVPAITTSSAAPLFSPASSATLFTYDVGTLPSVVLEGPRRPPRFFFA
jgi:hypothetical protein